MRRFLLPALTLLALTVTACGADDGTKPLAADTTSPSSSPSVDQQAAAKAAVTSYVAATSEISKHPDGSGLSGVATPTWTSKYVANYRKNVAAKGMKIVGSSKVVSATADVAGSTATVGACVDGTHLFFVPEGQKTSNGQSGPRARYTYRLVYQDSRWLVDGIETATAPC